MLKSLLIASSLAAPASTAIADCAEAEAKFQAFLVERYGSESDEVTIFTGDITADRWGIAAAMYISASDEVLRYAIPGRIPFLRLDDIGDPEELAAAASVALLAEETALCLRDTGTPMIIGDRDMGAQFDETHNPVLRDAIREFAEGLL